VILILTSPSGLKQSGAYAWGEGISFQFVSVATVGIHERERSESYGGPPGSQSRHLESVSRMSRDVHQRPDLLAGRSAMSTNVH
jgi:hypothetical protein